MNTLSFEVSGVRPVSKKNQLGISKYGGMYQRKISTPFIDLVKACALDHLWFVGRSAVLLSDDKPFTLEYTIHVKSYGTVDLDGVGTTLLDALQGIIYPNDKMCVGIVGCKVVSKKAPYKVEITVKWEGEL